MTTVPLCNILAYWADQYADEAVAVVHEELRVTWRELDAESNRVARAALREPDTHSPIVPWGR